MANARKKPAKAKSTKPKSAPTADVGLKVDLALKRAWEKALRVLEAAAREGMQAFDRKYEAVGDILEHEPPLYLAGGVATARGFVARYLPGEDERTVRRNVRVARYASPKEEAKYGTAKIDAIIDYLEARVGRPAKGRIPVDFAKLRIDGTPFADATVAQLKSATRAAARARGGGPANASPVVKEIVRCLPKDAKDVTVHYADGRVSLGRIPVRSFGAVLRALARAKVPTRDR